LSLRAGKVKFSNKCIHSSNLNLEKTSKCLVFFLPFHITSLFTILCHDNQIFGLIIILAILILFFHNSSLTLSAIIKEFTQSKKVVVIFHSSLPFTNRDDKALDNSLSKSVFR
jgi:hypothetical protein